MVVVKTFLIAVATILDSLINAYIWVVIIATILTWLRPDPLNPIVQILYRLTFPVLEYIRRYIPTIIGGIDLSPIILIVFLQFIDLFLVRLLFEFANSL